MTKDFGPITTGAARIAAEKSRVAQMLVNATPPAEMRAAPVAPARGVMQLVQNFDLMPGGLRRQDGAHWVQPTRLDLINARAVEGARATDPDVPRAKVEVFTPAQVAMAAHYRDLVEWVSGSGVKSSRLERGTGGSKSTDRFQETYSGRTEELNRLRVAIGDGVIMSPRRHMDRDNARRPLTVRFALDAMVLNGWSISKVISKQGWAAKGTTRKAVQEAIRAALDRMQGYRDAEASGRIATWRAE